MAETTYYLEIDIGEYYSIQQRMAFATKEAAMAQLNLIEPKVGQGRFRNDPELNRHRIVGEDGELVIVLDHVRSVRVIDRAAFNKLSEYSNNVAKEESAFLAEQIAKAVVIAHQTLLGLPVPPPEEKPVSP